MILPLDIIRLDGGTQSRAALSEQALDDYAEAMRDGAQFPALVVFHDGNDYWLADGFHRVRAAERAGLDELEAEVRQGSQRDAVLYSVGANAKNGVPRSPADKRRAVLRLLEDAEWSRWSDREVARQACVSHEFVRRERAKASGNVDRCEPRMVQRGGKTYEMNTAGIGAKKADPQPAPVSPPPPSPPQPPPGLFAELRARLAAGERIAPSDEPLPPRPHDEWNPPTETDPRAAATVVARGVAAPKLSAEERARLGRLARGEEAEREECAPIPMTATDALRALLPLAERGARTEAERAIVEDARSLV